MREKKVSFNLQSIIKKNKVFILSLMVLFVIVIWGLFFKQNFIVTSDKILKHLVNKYGWFYLISTLSFVIFCIWIAFSKYGKIKLGSDDSKPQYSYISWFAMLFSAGMGIGLVFWGVAEPLKHYVNPLNLEGGTPAAADFAIKKSFFHWGLHPWATYCLLALALAYFNFRKKLPGLISSIFTPLIGEDRVKGGIGQLIDILAIITTAIGVATSLGFGTEQINSGLNFIFGVPNNKLMHIIIVFIVTVLFMLSAITGLDKGIKWLSNANLMVAIILAISALLIGPTLKIIEAFTNGLGMYFGNFIRDSFHIEVFRDKTWFGKWTIFYWAWWVTWAPFVGSFIARISKGRTIKEFVLGVIFVPSLGCFLWFSIFGTMGINLGLNVAEEAIKSTSTAFFKVMSYYPFGFAISVIAIILLGTFFITSADSATFVLGMMSSKGHLNPSTKRKITWGVIQSCLALTLMFAGGLEMLQTAAIITAFPFVFIMLFTMVSLIKDLRKEVKNK